MRSDRAPGERGGQASRMSAMRVAAARSAGCGGGASSQRQGSRALPRPRVSLALVHTCTRTHSNRVSHQAMCVAEARSRHARLRKKGWDWGEICVHRYCRSSWREAIGSWPHLRARCTCAFCGVQVVCQCSAVRGEADGVRPGTIRFDPRARATVGALVRRRQ